MALFIGVQAVQLSPTLHGRTRRWLAPVWTLAFLLCVGHVLAAFHLVHHWSHSAAYRDTAEQTRQLLGVAYGAGVYFNYAFLFVWAVDVGWTWAAGSVPNRPLPWWIRLGRWYLLFIAFNGAVVFASGAWRWVGAAVTCLWLALALTRPRQRRPE
jgi:hypothetical protein